MRAWLKRLAKRAAIGVAVLVGLVFGLLVTVLVVAHTDWGRAKTIVIVQDVAAGALNAKLKIGRLEGFYLDEITIRDVVLEDAKGRVAVAVSAIHADYDLIALLGGEIRVEAVRVERPVVTGVIDGGQLNLLTLAKPSDSPPSSGPVVLPKLVVREVSLTDGAFSIDGQTVGVKDLAIRAHASAEGEDAAVTIKTVGVDLLDPPMRIEVRGGVTKTKNTLGVENLTITADDATVAFTETTLSIATLAAKTNVAITVPAAFLQRVLRDANLKADVDVRARVSHADLTAPWIARVGGNVAGAPLSVSATVAPTFTGLGATVALRDFDPRRAYALAPSGTIDLDVTSDVDGLDPKTLVATSTVGLRAHLAGAPRAVELTAFASLAGGLATVETRMPPGRDRLNLRARVRPFDGVTVEAATVAILLEELGDFIPASFGIGGRLVLDADVSGPVDDLKATATVDAKNIVVPGVRVGGVISKSRLHGLPGAPAGRAAAVVTGVKAGSTAVEFVTVVAAIASDAQGQNIDLDIEGRDIAIVDQLKMLCSVRIDGAAVAMNLTSLSATTGKIDWTSKKARLSVDEKRRLSLSNFEFSSRYATVTASAAIDVRKPANPTGTAAFAVEASDLETISRALLPSGPHVRGRIATDVTAHLAGAKTTLSADGTASKLALLGGEGEIDGRWRATLRNRKLSAEFDLGGEILGRTKGAVVLVTPANLFDAASWQRDVDKNLVRARLDFVDLDVAGALRFAGQKPVLRGRIGGHTEMSGRLEGFDVDLRGEALGMPDLAEDLSFAVKGTLDGDALDVNVETTFAGRPASKVVLRLPSGVRDVRQSGLRALLDQDIDVRADISEFSLSTLRGLVGRPDLAGTIRAQGVLHRRGDDLSVEGTGAALGVVVRSSAKPIGARWSLVQDGRALTLTLTSTAGGLGTTEAHMNLLAPPRPGRLSSWTAAAKDPRALITGIDADVRGLRLRAARKLGGISLPVFGTVSAQLLVEPRLKQTTARVSLRDAQGPMMARSLDGEMYLAISAQTTTVEGGLFDRGRPIVDLEGHVEAGLDTVLDAGSKAPDVIKAAKLDWDAHVFGFPLDLLAGADVGGATRGRLRVQGTVDKPVVTLQIDASGTRLSTLTFDEARFDATYVDNTLTATGIARQTDGGTLDLEALGTADDLAGTLTSERFDIGLASAFLGALNLPIAGVHGKMQSELHFAIRDGTTDVGGKLKIDALRVTTAPPIPPIDDGTITIDFDNEHVALNVAARSSDGKITTRIDANIADLARPTFTGQIVLDDVPIAAGPRVARINYQIGLKGARKDGKLNVAVDLGEALVELPQTATRKFHPIERFADVRYVDQRGVREAETQAWQDQTKNADRSAMAITIKTSKALLVRGNELDASFHTNLRVDGAIGIHGLVQAERGEVELFGRRWTIDRADLSFDGNVPPDPQVQVRLSYEFPTAVVYVDVEGTRRAPKLRFSAEPPIYDEAEILLFVLGGSPGDQPSDQPVNEQAKGAATDFLVGQVQSRIAEKVPIDTLKLGVDETSESYQLTSITVGKWITSRVFIAYQHRFVAGDDENSSEASIIYRLGNGFNLEAKYGFGKDHNGGADVVWTKRF